MIEKSTTDSVIPDQDDIPIIDKTTTDSVPYPVAQLEDHVFDDGEIRILKILISDYRREVIKRFEEAALDEELSHMPPTGCDEYGSLDDY